MNNAKTLTLELPKLEISQKQVLKRRSSGHDVGDQNSVSEHKDGSDKLHNSALHGSGITNLYDFKK